MSERLDHNQQIMASFTQFQHQVRVGTSNLLQLAYDLSLPNLMLLVLSEAHVANYLTLMQQWCATAGCVLLIVCVSLMIRQNPGECLVALLRILRSMVWGGVFYGVVVATNNVLAPNGEDLDPTIRTIGTLMILMELFIVLVAMITRVLCLPDPDDEDEKTDDSIDEAYKPLINIEKPIAYIHTDAV